MRNFLLVPIILLITSCTSQDKNGQEISKNETEIDSTITEQKVGPLDQIDCIFNLKMEEAEQLIPSSFDINEIEVYEGQWPAFVVQQNEEDILRFEASGLQQIPVRIIFFQGKVVIKGDTLRPGDNILLSDHPNIQLKVETGDFYYLLDESFTIECEQYFDENDIDEVSAADSTYSIGIDEVFSRYAIKNPVIKSISVNRKIFDQENSCDDWEYMY
ncbi:hypothetical protein K6119_14540 [Paracrocinitomix mangrovi]|uniref:hypothetical protein n=1 Tax=Paracrocinitomix mangrovi TaxID=2862509 RepID=UPI001C8E031F|nr:hypothetical protein [Paracrocinitomix mangrovi]UKN00950.1 hypothetical protein K6119_14540 [Paracrocinitomix mangrovi]